mmetsp:Transcript_46348/g.110154  ORF Transcript_46348/g.110154 Transcript_46348/m.110154 type:complete len:223 (-) Transcript_46348:1051-1719(-)
MAILVDGLHDIGEDHRPLDTGIHLCAAVENAPVVHHDHGVLGPVEATFEPGLFQQSRPPLVGLHVSVIDIIWQCRHTSLCLRLDDFLEEAILVQGQHWVSVHQLEGEALGVVGVSGITAVHSALCIDVVPAAVGDTDLRQQLVVFRVVLTEVLSNHQAVDHLRSHRSSRLVHKLQIARRAMIDGVVGVHRKRVLVVVIRARLLPSSLRVDHTKPGRPYRMLV